MNVCCANPTPLADVGQGLWRHVICHAYRPDEPFRGLLSLAWPLVGLGVAAVALVLFRLSRTCVGLAHTRPRLFRMVHGPYLVPLGLMLGALGLALCAPGYISTLLPYRPEAWPGLGFIGAQTVYEILGWGLAVGLGAVGLMAYRAGRDGSNHEKGSARWATWREITTDGTWRWTLPLKVSFRGSMGAWVTGAGKTVLALAEETVVRHLLMAGQTGAGKGFRFFAHIIRSSKKPFIYQDAKGQAPGKDSVKARFGKDPILWGCAAQGGWPSMGWNPVEECRQDPRPADAFAALAVTLIPGRTDSDWVAELARPILAHVLEHGGFATLGDLQDALVEQGLDPVLAAARVPQGLLAALEGKNVREYLGTTFYAALSPFQTGWGREVTSRHDFSLADACTTCTYVLSAETNATRRTPIVVFWQMLLRRLLQSSKPVPLTLLFDEALAAGKIPNVRDALVALRDRKVSIIFGTQHLTGLREVYGPAEGDSLIASFTGRIFLLNGLDPRDREWLVKALGQRTLREQRNKTTTTTAIPLLTLDDLNRRASNAKAHWVILEGPGMSRTGDPIMARMIDGPKDLIQEVGEEEAPSRNPAPEPLQPISEPEAQGIDLDEL